MGTEPETSTRRFTRRRALKIGALAGIGGAAAAAYKLGPWSRPLGSNADIRLGFAGLRNKGTDHLNHFREIPGCRIVALCDVDQEFLDREAAVCAAAKEPVTLFRDFRKMVESPDIDAIVIASPNHWHALMGVWALRAGKHIYVEKPLTHSIWEGEKLVAAAEASNLVAQTGTQRRSDMAYQEAKEWLASGALGTVRGARVVVYNYRNRVNRRKTPAVLPATLDYDLWCGPAAVETLYRSKVHHDWHWDWNTGNGELGNNGVHYIDTARILLGEPGLPKQTLSIGGRFAWGDDAGQTPNTQLTLFDGALPIISEVRNLPMKPNMEAMDHDRGIRMGTIIECEGGFLAWPVAYDRSGKKVKKFKSDDGHGHRVNWLKAIVNNQSETVHAPMRTGHISTSYCHLGNLSHRLGAEAPPAEIAS
jgi:predicted dehydrogenase